MAKRLCACGCGDRVTRKVEEQHINALAPSLLTSQVLNQNRRLIRQKKRSQVIGFPSRVRQQLAMGNTTITDNMDIDHDDNEHVSLDSSMMMGEDLDHEAYGQSMSRSGRSRHVAPHAGPSSLTHDDSRHVAPHACAGPSSLNHDDSLLLDPRPNEDIFMDHSAPSISLDPLPDAYAGMHMGENLDGEVYGLSNLRRSRRIADSVEKIGKQRWGSNINASAYFVNNGEESDEEEEDIEDDEPISDFDIDEASDEEDDDEMFAGPGQEGISLWDSLGEGFLREASQLRMSFWLLLF